MLNFSWNKWLGAMTRAGQTKKARKAKIARVGQIEGLEDRALLSSFAISDAQITEPDAGGTANMVFTVTFSRDVGDAGTYTVDLATQDGVGAGGARSVPVVGNPGTPDFNAASATVANVGPFNATNQDNLTFAPGSNVLTFTVPILGDNIDEQNETFVVNLTNVQIVGGSVITPGIADGVGTGTILDNDPTANPNVTLSIGPLGAPGSPAIKDAAIGEDGGTAILTATLDVLSSQDVTVNLTYTGPATVNSDFTVNGGVAPNSPTGAFIFIPAGSLTGTVTLTGLSDAPDEIDERVTVDVTGVTNGTEAVATVKDDPALGGLQAIPDTAAPEQRVVVTLLDSDIPNFFTDPTASVNIVVNPVVVIAGQVAEAGGTATATVTLNAPAGPNGATIQLQYGAAGLANATKGVDYTTSSAFYQGTGNGGTSRDVNETLFIPAGQSSATVTITATQDVIDEIDEVLRVSISSVGNLQPGSVNAPFGPQILITDDDAGTGVPSVTLAVLPPATSNITEAAGTTNTTTITATLSTVAAVDVTVNLAYSGTATDNADLAGDDYDVTAPIPPGGVGSTITSLIIPAGSLSATLVITADDAPAQDPGDEVTETIIAEIISVVNGTEATPQSVTVSITDNETPAAGLPFATLIAPPVTTLVEAGGTYVYTVALSAAPGAGITTVLLNYGGTATLGPDYTVAVAAAAGLTFTAPNQLSFTGAATTATVTITAVQDLLDEPDEPINIEIAEVANGFEGNATGTLPQLITATILDDDAQVVPTVTLAVTPASIAEAAGAATVTANLSTTTSVAVTVTVAYSGTSTNGTDYIGATTIVIPAGATSASTTITAIQDATDEPDETVIATISGATNASLGATLTGTTTITDDDPTAPVVTLSVASGTIAEAAGTTSVTATLSNVTNVPTTISLGFSGTATNVADFAATATTIVIPAGATSGSVTLTAVQDAVDEPNETIIVDITAVSGGGGATESGTQTATVTITDDDPPLVPGVTLSVTPATIAEAAGTATITAALSAATSVDVTVSLAYTGTATNGTDYASVATIVVPAGSTTASITLTATQDLVEETGGETVIVDINSVTNGTETGVQTGTVTITDDDAVPTVTLAAAPATVAEAAGATGLSTITATLSNTANVDVVITLATSGTAAATDFSQSATTITIPAGGLTGSVTVQAAADSIDENDETVIVDIATVTGATEAVAQTVTVTITDDDTNVAPVATNDIAFVNANGTVTQALPATDANGDALTFTAGADAAANGTVTFNADGTFTYVSNGTAGLDTFSFVASDGALSSNEGTITVDVNGIPVVTNSSLSLKSGETKFASLGSATDAEGDALTYTVLTQPAAGSGTLNVVGSAYSFTADPAFIGTTSFTFKANDGAADSNVGTVTINVATPNNAPLTQNGTVAVVAGTPANGTFTATDADGNALTFSVVAPAANGTVTVGAGGTFTYTLNAGSTATSDSFTFKANDGTVDSNVSTITVSINQTPVAVSPATVTVDAFGTATGTLTGTDANGTALTFAVTQPTKGTVTVNPTTGAFTYVSNGTTGPDSFTFTVSDGVLTSTAATVSVNVNDVDPTIVLSGADGVIFVKPGKKNPAEALDATAKLGTLLPGTNLTTAVITAEITDGAVKGDTLKMLTSNDGTVQITSSAVKVNKKTVAKIKSSSVKTTDAVTGKNITIKKLTITFTAGTEALVNKVLASVYAQNSKAIDSLREVTFTVSGKKANNASFAADASLTANTQ